MSHDSLNLRNTWYDSYDFIVVGAGTSGSIVAARLAEHPTVNVLLLEAGGPETILSDIPALTNQLVGNNVELDWNYPIVSQKNAYRANINNQVNISRGRAFGGSGMHNNMNYYRAPSGAFQWLTDETGVKNWTYADVVPYYMKSENNLDRFLVATWPYNHGTGGPIAITSAVPDPILRAFLLSAPLMGYRPTYPDGFKQMGTSLIQRNILNGVRQSTSKGFLENNPRHNLHTLGQTMVTKVLFNERKRAIGVQFFRRNKFYNVFARKEVIMGAGAIGSPQLLMLSGIGPRQQLEKLGIPVISDLRVGELLRSVNVIVPFDIKNQSLIDKPIENLKNFYDYFVKHTGPLTYMAYGVTCFPQIPLPGYPDVSKGCIWPKINFQDTDLEKTVANYKSKAEWREYYRPYVGRAYFELLLVLNHPKSAGSIRLASKNPFVYPTIDPCVFCNQQDINDMITIFKLSLPLFTNKYMRPLIEPYRNPIPGCHPCPHVYYCDSYIRCIIQTFAATVYPIGGCRLGRAGDKRAVVDQRLRVLGVSGLRVIDSSIFPVTFEMIFGTTIMFGEYGSHFIKQEYNLS